MKSIKNNKTQIFTTVDVVTILAGTAIGVGVGLFLAGMGNESSLEGTILSVALPAIVLGIASAGFSVRRAASRGKITSDSISSLKEAQQPLPKQMLSASKDHPLIGTLVYNNSINDLASETLAQDKMLANAKQILASMDHTTASMH